MLISGGGLRFAQPPAVGRRPTVGGTKLRFRSSADAGGPVNFATKRNEWHRLLQNASKCSEAFRNAMARMTYCLGHPANVASIGPVIPSANLCKNLYNFVNFCIRKQNFAELTPVHLWMTSVDDTHMARTISTLQQLVVAVICPAS